MQATDDLLQESNSRISNLMTTQALQATSLSTLERILLQQTATLNNQVELLRTWKANESTTTTTTTLSTPSSMPPTPQISDDMDVVNTSPQSTLKRSRRLSALEPFDMRDATYHPDLSNYARKQRSVLFTFLDNKDEFELKQTLTCGYMNTDKYRPHNWAANDIGLYSCCNPHDEDACLTAKCPHFAAAILCDEYNCINEHCQNKVGSLPMTPEDYVETFITAHTGTGLRTL
jgi:uncharacterized coiled-coil protein SlyX